MSAQAVHRPLRVAIIDDEADVLTFLRVAFEDHGFDVATCDQPSTALGLLRDFHPDLVCLDLLMPEQMGVSLYAQMRRVPGLETVPVLILTGLDADEASAALSAHASGVPAPDGTVEKPIDVARLFGAVDTVLAKTAGGSP